jgi:hypothetical protein
MASPLDPQLDRLLAALVVRLGGSSETAIFLRADEEEDIGELAEALVGAGLLLPAEPASAVICDGCERNCVMPVEIAPAINGRPARAFIVCDKRDDIGRVCVEPRRLRRWIFSLPLLARALAAALKTNQEPSEPETAGICRLGKARLGGNAIQITLSRSVDAISSDGGLAIVLSEPAGGTARGRWLALPNAVSFRDARLGPRLNALRAAMVPKRFGDPIVALEVRFDFGEVLLLDRIAGGSRTIATPILDSQTYRIFEILHAEPGRMFTTAELQQRTGMKALKSLHKIPENLNFSGSLKRLFFEVSKHSIRFRHEVTLGQLATYRIDPKTII